MPQRVKMGVIVPSTNTVVETDYNVIGPPGVSFHTGRAWIPEIELDSDEKFKELLDAIDRGIETGIRDVLTCRPDYMIMGMSGETFWGGAAGNEEFEARMRKLANGPVSTGATAVRKALEALGARRIGVLTPYMPIGDEQVQQYFGDHGYEIAKLVGLECTSANEMAEVTEERLREVLIDLADQNVDAIVQCGTNVSMVRLAAEAERWFGIPVIAINTATVWDALRTTGVADQYDGFGVLLRDH